MVVNVEQGLLEIVPDEKSTAVLCGKQVSINGVKNEKNCDRRRLTATEHVSKREPTRLIALSKGKTLHYNHHGSKYTKPKRRGDGPGLLVGEPEVIFAISSPNPSAQSTFHARGQTPIPAPNGENLSVDSYILTEISGYLARAHA